MSADDYVTTDHDTIRRWVEDRGGAPSTVKGSERNDESIGLLHLDFPGFADEHNFRKITWEQFFRKLDEGNLAMVYQDNTVTGKPSHYYRFVDRDSIEALEPLLAAGSAV